MAFKNKTDYCGLGDTNVIAVDDNKNESHSVAEAMNAKGEVTATTIYGATAAPTNNYVLNSDVTKTFTLGSVKTVNTNEYYCLTNVTISTSNGDLPKISATCESVPSATASSTFTVSSLAITNDVLAQILANAFTLSGSGCNLTSCTAKISCKISPATKDGAKIAWDCYDGRIEVTANINQTGETEPTVAAGSDTSFVNTTKLTCNNPDSNYPTWTVGFTKYLAKDTPAT